MILRSTLVCDQRRARQWKTRTAQALRMGIARHAELAGNLTPTIAGSVASICRTSHPVHLNRSESTNPPPHSTQAAAHPRVHQRPGPQLLNRHMFSSNDCRNPILRTVKTVESLRLWRQRLRRPQAAGGGWRGRRQVASSRATVCPSWSRSPLHWLWE